MQKTIQPCFVFSMHQSKGKERRWEAATWPAQGQKPHFRYQQVKWLFLEPGTEIPMAQVWVWLCPPGPVPMSCCLDNGVLWAAITLYMVSLGAALVKRCGGHPEASL